MTNPLFAKNYTDKDYESMRTKIVEVIPYLTDNWTDFNESEPGMAYVEIASGLADMLFYYLDKQALENYLTTVEQRKNMKAILSVVGYKMDYYRSSSCKLTISLDEAYAYKIVIPEYTQLVANKGTINETYFATTLEVTLNAGETSVDTEAMEGQAVFDSIKIKEISNFKFQLNDKKIAVNSVKLSVNDIVLEEVPDIFLHDSGGLYFSASDDKDEYTWVRLMPDWKNYVSLLENDEMTIKYLISSGSKGIASVGEINQAVDNIYDEHNLNVTQKLSFSNTENASGGSDPETIAEAAYQAPREVKTMWTAVTLEDFKTLSEGQPGIRLVNVIDWSDFYGDFTHPNLVVICIVPEVGRVASASMKESLLELLNERKLVSLDIELVDPTYEEFNISANVYVKDRTLYLPDISTAVELILRQVYNAEYSSFNNHIRVSKIISLIHSTHPSITRVELTSPTTDHVMSSYELTDLKTVTLTVNYDNAFNEES